MKRFAWDADKAETLRNDDSRGNVGFEDCVIAIEDGRILDDLPHPSPGYTHQRLLVLSINNYAYVVPYVENDEEIFLKTVFPSWKYTHIYLQT